MNKKLFIAMSAAAGAFVPAVASADFAPQKTRMVASSPTDFAPITGAQGTTPGRLRRTDQEQPGNEMAHVAMFGGANATKGLYFSMNVDIVDPAAPTVSHRANNKMQLAMVPFELVQDAATGAVSAKPNFTGIGNNTATTGGVRFVTNNNGNEQRNANHPQAFRIADNVICAEYNYQPNNNTERYTQCFDTAGKTLLAQTRIYAKNNDDCAMSQDDGSTHVVEAKADGTTRVVKWYGCNGNGQDDGWASWGSYKVDNLANPTKVTYTQQGDVSLAAREERSHGKCTTGTDSNVAICSWTEGNTQPQRDGVWLAAIDLTKNGQASILWKQMIEGRVTLPNGQRAYAMRAMSDRIEMPDATTGELKKTDMIVWRHGVLSGNNNTNNKGGQYYGNMMGVIEATRSGMKYVVPLTDMSSKLLGLEATHLAMKYSVVGSTDALKPTITIVGGNPNGGYFGAQVQHVVWDQATNKMSKGEAREAAPYDMHLYPNYLGNNPGNQGRNYADIQVIKNPFVTKADAGKDLYLMMIATSGKDMADQPSATCLDCAKIKLSAYLTIMPIASNPMGTGTGNGSGTGGGTGMGSGSDSGSGSDTGAGSDDTGTGDDTGVTDPGASLGGCSTSGGSSGAATLLLIGLAAFIRRRR